MTVGLTMVTVNISVHPDTPGMASAHVEQDTHSILMATAVQVHVYTCSITSSIVCL